MKTRLATINDLKPLAELFNQYRNFYKQKSNIQGAKKFLSDRIQNQESVIFLVENESSSTIGFAQLYPSFSSVSMKRLWILNDLFIDEKFRGKHAGKILLAACLTYARETEAKGLTLKTAHDNFIAQKLYEQCGWKKDSVFVSYNISV